MSNITKSAVVALVLGASAPAFAGGMATSNQPTTVPTPVVAGGIATQITVTPTGTGSGSADIVNSLNILLFVEALAGGGDDK